MTVAAGVTLERKDAKGQLLSSNDRTGEFTALVSITNVPDDGNDIILPGAYSRTLRTRLKSAKVGVLSNHDWNQQVGRVLDAEEWLPGDSRLPADLLAQGAGALWVRGKFNMKTQMGRDTYEMNRFYAEEGDGDGRACEFSIGYECSRPGPDGEARSYRDAKTGYRMIKALDLFEVSSVLVGMASGTRALSFKSLQHVAQVAGKREMTLPEFLAEMKTMDTSDDDPTVTDDEEAPLGEQEDTTKARRTAAEWALRLAPMIELKADDGGDGGDGSGGGAAGGGGNNWSSFDEQRASQSTGRRAVQQPGPASHAPSNAPAEQHTTSPSTPTPGRPAASSGQASVSPGGAPKSVGQGPSGDSDEGEEKPESGGGEGSGLAGLLEGAKETVGEIVSEGREMGERAAERYTPAPAAFANVKAIRTLRWGHRTKTAQDDENDGDETNVDPTDLTGAVDAPEDVALNYGIPDEGGRHDQSAMKGRRTVETKYSDSQERDDNGRFASGNGSSSADAKAETAHQAATAAGLKALKSGKRSDAQAAQAAHSKAAQAYRDSQVQQRGLYNVPKDHPDYDGSPSPGASSHDVHADKMSDAHSDLAQSWSSSNSQDQRQHDSSSVLTPSHWTSRNLAAWAGPSNENYHALQHLHDDGKYRSSDSPASDLYRKNNAMNAETKAWVSLAGSYESTIHNLGDAVDRWLDEVFPGQVVNSWVEATYGDHVIVGVCSAGTPGDWDDPTTNIEFWKVPYSEDDGDVITLGTPSQVNVQGVAVDRPDDDSDEIDFMPSSTVAAKALGYKNATRLRRRYALLVYQGGATDPAIAATAQQSGFLDEIPGAGDSDFRSGQSDLTGPDTDAGQIPVDTDPYNIGDMNAPKLPGWLTGTWYVDNQGNLVPSDISSSLYGPGHHSDLSAPPLPAALSQSGADTMSSAAVTAVGQSRAAGTMTLAGTPRGEVKNATRIRRRARLLDTLKASQYRYAGHPGQDMDAVPDSVTKAVGAAWAEIKEGRMLSRNSLDSIQAAHSHLGDLLSAAGMAPDVQDPANATAGDDEEGVPIQVSEAKSALDDDLIAQWQSVRPFEHGTE